MILVLQNAKSVVALYFIMKSASVSIIQKRTAKNDERKVQPISVSDDYRIH